MKGSRVNIGLETKLSQKLLITPQMKQSLEILQKPLTELQSEIDTYLEENPILEVGEDRQEEKPADKPEEKESSFEDDIINVDWDELYRDSGELYYKPSSDSEEFDFERFVKVEETLYDHLEKQVIVLGLKEKDEVVALHIIGSLDDDGYFRADVDEIADEVGCEPEKVAQILKLIQNLEPAGIAATSLHSCIAKQLLELGIEQVYVDLAAELLENYSNYLINYKYEEAMSEMSIEKDTFDYLLELIRKTDPKPGLGFSGGGRHITPDVYIVKSRDGKYEVVLNEEGMPALKMNTYYIRLMKQANQSEEARKYLEEKVKGAIWLIKSLNKRQKAIYKVARAIVDVQKEFLDKGEKYLKPLKLKDIAEVTELHESTVSRVTSGKYAMTEGGVFELKYFFVKGLDSDSGDMSTQKVKVMIRNIVEEEDPESPYSDEKIVEILQKKGIKIARRTVAKYRDELNIPTKSQRKRIRR